MKKLSILGSTGSVGRQSLEVVRAFPEKFQIVGLSAGKKTELLKEQILEFRPQYICVLTEKDRQDLDAYSHEHSLNLHIFVGTDGLVELATLNEHSLLIVAIVGTASLMPTYRAIQKGITIGLACKEVLVSGGSLIMALARKMGVSVLPIDSEHAALKQCLAGVGEDPSQVEKLILTASGGPFLHTPLEAFPEITLEQALKHPSWTMGSKITIDSATLMNKGLEVIEAFHLFQVPFEKIVVVVHPHSIVHSMVEFIDGTILSHMGLPDMRFPLQYVMTYPEKWANPWPKTKMSELPALQFFEPDFQKFPLLKLAFECGALGGTFPVVMNAANEAIVSLFLDKKLSFSDIPALVKKSVDSFDHFSNPSLEEIVAIDTSVKERLIYDA